MRRIGIIVGSENDFLQCGKGFRYLIEQTHLHVDVLFVNVTSIHRNTKKLLEDLEKMSKAPPNEKIDALIIGAGWANHLSCTSDAFLRNHLRDRSIVVYAVAFEDMSNPAHTQAAVLSITQVPGTKVIFSDYVGPEGFYRACYDAVNDELSLIELAPVKKPLEFTLPGAFARYHELLIEKIKEGGK